MNSYVSLVHLCHEQYPIDATDCLYLGLTPAVCLAKLISETLQSKVYRNPDVLIDEITLQYVGVYDNSPDIARYVSKIGSLSVEQHRVKVKTVLQGLKSAELKYKANLNIIK